MEDSSYSEYGLSAEESNLLDSLTAAYLSGKLRGNREDLGGLSENETLHQEVVLNESLNHISPASDEILLPATDGQVTYSWLIEPSIADEDPEFAHLLEQLVSSDVDEGVGTSSGSEQKTEDTLDDNEASSATDTAPLHRSDSVTKLANNRFANACEQIGLTTCADALSKAPLGLPGIGAGTLEAVKNEIRLSTSAVGQLLNLPEWLTSEVATDDSYGHYAWDALGFLHRFFPAEHAVESVLEFAPATSPGASNINAFEASVDLFGFTPSIRAALRKLGIKQMGQLVGVSDELLCSQRGVGIAALAKIDRALHSIGLARQIDDDSLGDNGLRKSSRERPESDASTLQGHQDEQNDQQHNLGGTPITDAGFTPRVNRALKQLGISELEQLKGVSDEMLLAQRGIGVKAIDEIDAALSMVGLTRSSNERPETAPETAPLQPTPLSNAMREDAARAMAYFGMAHPSLRIDERCFFSWATYYAALDSDGCSSDFYHYIIDSVRSDAYEPSVGNSEAVGVESWLESGDIDERAATILKMRFLGATLQECADRYELTRERARQLSGRALERRPALKEDEFTYLASEYEVSDDILTELFSLSNLSCGYIRLTAQGNKQKKGLSESLLDNRVPAFQRSAISDYLSTRQGGLSTATTREHRMILLEDRLKKATQNGWVDCREFFSDYSVYIAMNYPEHADSLIPASSRSLNGLLHRSDFAVFTSGERVRYKELSREYLSTLVVSLGLSRYHGEEISTLLCYRKSKALLDRMDVRDEYELHYLLRKAQEYEVEPSITKALHFGRSPMVEISCKGVREMQVISLIQELSPVDVGVFAEAYEQRFGVNRATFLGTWKRAFSSYISGDTFVFHEEALSPSDVELIASSMKLGFTTLSRLQDCGPDGPSVKRKCNLTSLSASGFKLLERCIFTADSDPQHIFQELLGPGADISNLDEEVSSNGLFKQELAKLTRSYELIEVQRGIFVPFEEAHTNPEECRDFCNRVYGYSSSTEPFTIRSLRLDGFSHELIRRGCSDYMLEKILANDTGGRFTRSSIDGNLFFSRGIRGLSFLDVAYHAMGRAHSVNSIALSALLEEKYAVRVPPEKIASRLWLSGLLPGPDASIPIAPMQEGKAGEGNATLYE